jgi:hypothetical protein
VQVSATLQANPAGVPTPPVLRSAAASRRVNRRGAALSVLVILLGGVIAFSAARILTKHTSVLVIAHAVTAGSTINDGDLTTAQISSDPHLSAVKASDRHSVVGKIAQVNLSPGELVAKSQFGSSDGFTAGQILVALPLKDGQFPGRGVKTGQKVQVVNTPGETANQDSTSSGNDGKSGSSTGQVFAATVADVGHRNADSQVTVVDVRVSAGNAVSVAQLASTGNAAIILLPPGK